MNRERKNAESFKAYHRHLTTEEGALRRRLQGKYLYRTGWRVDRNGRNIPAISDGRGGYR